MPVILATQEAKIRKITVWSQPREVVQETLSQKKNHKIKGGGVAQGVDFEFKPHWKKNIANCPHLQSCSPTPLLS
jgi:hypothetical protein